MTYIIKRHKRRFNNKAFSSYEEARSYIRRWLRSKSLIPAVEDSSWVYYNNPSHSRYGFRITAVD